VVLRRKQAGREANRTGTIGSAQWVAPNRLTMYTFKRVCLKEQLLSPVCVSFDGCLCCQNPHSSTIASNINMFFESLRRLKTWPLQPSVDGLAANSNLPPRRRRTPLRPDPSKKIHRSPFAVLPCALTLCPVSFPCVLVVSPTPCAFSQTVKQQHRPQPQNTNRSTLKNDVQ
jgi:hypothetical protein